MESLCHDVSKSALLIKLLTSAMNICIEGYTPATTSIARADASSCFSVRLIEGDWVISLERTQSLLENDEQCDLSSEPPFEIRVLPHLRPDRSLPSFTRQLLRQGGRLHIRALTAEISSIAVTRRGNRLVFQKEHATPQERNRRRPVFRQRGPWG